MREYRGLVEIIAGILLFVLLVGGSIIVVYVYGAPYARALRYFILSGMLVAVTAGFFTGLLVYSGYKRAASE